MNAAIVRKYRRKFFVEIPYIQYLKTTYNYDEIHQRNMLKYKLC